MVYVDTRRPFWSLPMTTTRFLGTVAVLGVATAAVARPSFAAPVAVLGAAKLALESAALRRTDPAWKSTLVLLDGPVGFPARLRVALGGLGVLAAVFSAPFSLALLVAAEFLERLVFFRAAAAWRMPGTR